MIRAAKATHLTPCPEQACKGAATVLHTCLRGVFAHLSRISRTDTACIFSKRSNSSSNLWVVLFQYADSIRQLLAVHAPYPAPECKYFCHFSAATLGQAPACFNFLAAAAGKRCSWYGGSEHPAKSGGLPFSQRIAPLKNWLLGAGITAVGTRLMCARSSNGGVVFFTLQHAATPARASDVKVRHRA